MSGFLPENPGVLPMDVIAEIRRRHLIEKETISSLAIAFKLSRPTIRKHLKTVEEPVYQRKNQPHPMQGSFREQLQPGWSRKRSCRVNKDAPHNGCMSVCKSRVTVAVIRRCSVT
jgi:hypothetical protein